MMDIDNEDKEHKKIWCIGTNQDYEKEYLRLTGVGFCFYSFLDFEMFFKIYIFNFFFSHQSHT